MHRFQLNGRKSECAKKKTNKKTHEREIARWRIFMYVGNNNFLRLIELIQVKQHQRHVVTTVLIWAHYLNSTMAYREMCMQSILEHFSSKISTMTAKDQVINTFKNTLLTYTHAQLVSVNYPAIVAPPILEFYHNIRRKTQMRTNVYNALKRISFFNQQINRSKYYFSVIIKINEFKNRFTVSIH